MSTAVSRGLWSVKGPAVPSGRVASWGPSEQRECLPETCRQCLLLRAALLWACAHTGAPECVHASWLMLYNFGSLP